MSDKTKSLTKASLAAEVAAQLGIPQLKAEDAVDAVINELTEAFRTGQRVEIRGFGVFKPRMSKARMGRNPKTGTPAPIPSRLVVKFNFTAPQPSSQPAQP